MTYLSRSDLNHFFCAAPVLLSATPMIRKQGNGNFTGFVRKAFADGSSFDEEFIVNARSREDVTSAYRAGA